MLLKFLLLLLFSFQAMGQTVERRFSTLELSVGDSLEIYYSIQNLSSDTIHGLIIGDSLPAALGIKSYSVVKNNVEIIPKSFVLPPEGKGQKVFWVISKKRDLQKNNYLAPGDILLLRYVVSAKHSDTLEFNNDMFFGLFSQNGQYVPFFGYDKNTVKIIISDNPNSIEEDSIDNTNEIHLYPNPAANQFFLLVPDIQNNENMVLHMYNILGERVFQQKLIPNKNLYVISLKYNYLPRGIYFIQLLLKNRIIAKKIIINGEQIK